MKTETTEIKKAWYEVFEEKTYNGIKYKMYENTPKGAEEKIKTFLDNIYDNDLKKYQPEIITEGSNTIIIDLWVFESYVSSSDIKNNNVLINRIKHDNGK